MFLALLLPSFLPALMLLVFRCEIVQDLPGCRNRCLNNIFNEPPCRLTVPKQHRFLGSNTTDHITNTHDNNIDISERCVKGYVLSLSYYDQVTSATGRMASLQCWAAQFGNLAVVEPFVTSSFLKMPQPNQNLESSTRFRDLFDFNHWNALTYSLHHRKQVMTARSSALVPLASWKEFIACAPREVVIVQILYKVRDVYEPPCLYPRLQDYWSSLLEPHGFNVVNYVCINMNEPGPMSEKWFNTHILGDYLPDVRVTLIFQEWRGIRNDTVLTEEANCSITLSHSVCTNAFGRHVALYSGLIPSSRIAKEADEYIQQYFNGNPYLAVMLRLERVIRYSGGVHDCLSRIRNHVQHLQTAHGLNNVFFTTDIGNYGSNTFLGKKIGNYSTTEYLLKVLDLLNIHREQQQTFERISSSKNSGYMSTLQKAIASRAGCLLLIGGGSFQLHTQHWHSLVQAQRGLEECVKTVKSC